MLSYVEYYQPKYFLLENVAGFIEHNIHSTLTTGSGHEVHCTIKFGMVKFVTRALIALGSELALILSCLEFLIILSCLPLDIKFDIDCCRPASTVFPKVGVASFSGAPEEDLCYQTSLSQSTHFLVVQRE